MKTKQIILAEGKIEKFKMDGINHFGIDGKGYRYFVLDTQLDNKPLNKIIGQQVKLILEVKGEN